MVTRGKIGMVLIPLRQVYYKAHKKRVSIVELPVQEAFLLVFQKAVPKMSVPFFLF
jgi:hypothetical protein